MYGRERRRRTLLIVSEKLIIFWLLPGGRYLDGLVYPRDSRMF